MKSQRTLRATLGRFTSITIFLVGLASVCIIVADSYFELKIKRNAVANTLIRSSGAQANLLIPTFILPEQQKGLGLVLSRIAQEDGLHSAQVISKEAEIPGAFSECRLSDTSSSCLNAEKDTLATITPIQDVGQNFGYLLKIKKLDSTTQDSHPVFLVGTVALVLIITFALLFWGMNRITSREVPKELDALVAWIDEILKERNHTKTPDLKFEELSALGKRIGELIDNYDRARDQAVIGQLTSGVMHDIRTPLQSVVAALELVRETTNPSDRNEMLENLYRISGIKTPMIGQIIETILDGSRDIHIEKKPGDLMDTIQEAIAVSADLAARKKIKVTISTSEDPMIVCHDPTQINRVIANLVKNAIEAAGSTTEPRRVLVVAGRSVSTQEVVLSVEDSGPGIQGKEDRLFRLFRSNKVHGSGLGLMITKKIVEAHGGTIHAGRSEALGGAKFEVVLPDEAIQEIKYTQQSSMEVFV